MMARATAIALVSALAGVTALVTPAAASPAIERSGIATDAIIGADPVDPTAEPTIEEVPLDGIQSEMLDTLDEPVVELDPGHADHADLGAHDGDTDGTDDDGDDVDEPLAVLIEREVPDGFDIMGVTWDSRTADVERVMARTRTGGDWTDWLELGIENDAPNLDTAEAQGARPGTDALIRTGSDAVQVRVETASGTEPAGLSMMLIGTQGLVVGEATVTGAAFRTGARAEAAGVSTALAAAAPSGRSAGSLEPPIVTRAQWGADESMRGPINQNSTVKAMIVHHTVNANGYTKSQAPGLVRGIYAYHVKGRGWSDVGYNFLVDRFGTVYEGRYGSIDTLPMGVHTGGFNTDTMGVAAIGDFRTTTPSSALQRSLVQVLAWKLGEFNRNATGTTVLRAGPGSSKQEPGWTGNVRVISSHRDLGSTACPGGRLYDLLPSIRVRVADLLSGTQGGVVEAAGVYDTGSVSLVMYTNRSTSWTVSFSSICSGRVERTYTGITDIGQRTVTWDLRDSDGKPVPPGVYRATVDRSWSGASYRDTHWVEVLADDGSPPETCGVQRLGGDDRYETAVELGRSAFPNGPEAVLVAGAQESVVDGLVAAPFAYSRKAPVLLAARDGLPAPTKAELERRDVTKVWLVGGEGILGSRLVKELKGMGVTVERLAGDDRFATAARVAREMGTTSGQVVFASGEQVNLIDSAAVSGAAAATGRPILLTLRNTVPAVTLDAVKDLDVEQGYLIGGGGAVTQKARGYLTDLGVSTTRFGGDDRFDTSAAIAEGFQSAVGSNEVMVAAGSDRNMIDSMAGGVLGHLTVLSNGYVVSSSVQTFLGSADVEMLVLAGGAGVIPPATVAVLDEARR